MPHICYLTNSFHYKDPLIFERQGRSLAKAGYKVTYVVSELNFNEIVDGVEIISSGYIAKNRFLRFFVSKNYLYKKALEINADIYQISEPELISVGVKLIQRGYKVIYNLRENYPAIIMGKPYLPKIIQKPISLLLEIYMKKQLQKYHAVFSVTTDLTEIVEKKWNISNSILLTNYPIVNINFQLSFEEYSSRENTLCYIGSIYRISRQEVIFSALENIPHMKYLLAGIIEERYDIASLPYWNKVIFINGFQKSELPSIFSKATISNILRDFSQTGTPNGSLGIIKMFESMEAGLPIICSDVPVNRQLIDKYNCGICVDSNSQYEIEEAIKFLMNNKSIAYQMGQNGRNAIIEKLNWNNQFIKYIEVLNKL